jgi:DNA-binding NtrC family response regulator
MTPRRGLVLDQSGLIFSALDALALPGWEFQLVSTIDAARKALASDPVLIGIVAFDHFRAWSQAELEALLARYDYEWIALLDEGLLRSENIPASLLRGFHDFHSLPLAAERLLVTLGHAWGKADLCRAQNPLAGETGRFGMIGTCRRMAELYRQIEKVVTVDAPVLIGGESGTGKELVSRAIHQHSSRRRGPFIAMNCGAISPGLIHSELFGYERGAFTGAVQRKVGSIEAAGQGVLFLDEIGDLPLDQQASLLRFLQEKMITRVGSTERIPVDVRVIAATHVDLQRAMAEGRFREDLYYRLNVLHLQVPALRERREDIPLLAESVFHDNRRQTGSRVRGLSAQALRAMVDYDWPGNVRELINRVQHAVIMSENRLISPADLGLPDISEEVTPTLDEVRASVEREVIEASLRKYQNNVSETARQLGVSRVTLYRMIDRLKIVL